MVVLVVVVGADVAVAVASTPNSYPVLQVYVTICPIVCFLAMVVVTEFFGAFGSPTRQYAKYLKNYI